MIFFLLQPNHIKKMVVENLRVTESHIRTYIFVIKCQNLLASGQQWGINFFLFTSAKSYIKKKRLLKTGKGSLNHKLELIFSSKSIDKQPTMG